MDQYLGQGPAVEFDETAYSVSEGDGTVEIHVSLASAPSAAFDVQFETLPGTATAGLDYEAASGVLTFTPTEYTRVIDIPVVSDFRPEVTESFHVALYYEGIELATGAVTIADDDPDTDGDGLSDYEEQNSLWGYASDPLLADTDHDRLSDWEEVSGFYGFVSDPSVSDTDGDGFSDYLESRFGLDPRDDLVFPTAIPSLEIPSW